MRRRVAAASVAAAVLISGGVAEAAWSKNGGGSGYAKAKTLTAPSGTATLSCTSNSTNNWKLTGWTSGATSTQAQIVTQTDGGTQTIAFNATTNITWSTSPTKGSFTATVVTSKGNNWRSGALTSNTISITASNGKC